ncbi:hypothetical protein CTI12_AA543830 [Artemisia annua]|uniref:Ribonucleotide reductase large subunit C-terminal domain-containing protein n=1 Tax=Artemisia annua TaxID=35608 RepID=A0A2U1KTD1_ARTAN|nr:hypothetical protein CTI12_AA543830 [Artemisia annua]
MATRIQQQNCLSLTFTLLTFQPPATGLSDPAILDQLTVHGSLNKWVFGFSRFWCINLHKAFELIVEGENLPVHFDKEEQRPRDLFYVLWIPDLFMERVQSNGQWYLFCPKLLLRLQFLGCYLNPFSPPMERKTPKCPPTVEANQFGCAWSFSGMFDHNHDRPHRKLLSDVSHGSKNIQGAGNARSQVQMLTFDEQLRSINVSMHFYF